MSMRRDLDRLTRDLNRFRYPLELLDDAGEVVYTIPTRDDIDTIEIVPGDEFISVVINDPDRPWRIKVVEYDMANRQLLEDDGTGQQQTLKIEQGR